MASAHNVISSGTALEYRHGEVYRAGGAEQPTGDGPGKPVHIWARIGHEPLLAGGDAAMLRTGRFGLLIRHDDAGANSATTAARRRHWSRPRNAAGRW
jgi:hypothetical protein